MVAPTTNPRSARTGLEDPASPDDVPPDVNETPPPPKPAPPNLWHLVLTGAGIAAGAALFSWLHKALKRRLR